MPAQSEWRFCRKCTEMFFNGGANNGVCPAGGAHEAAGHNFTLPHDEVAPDLQDQWRFCPKCCVMFFNGGANNGVCPAAGAHEAVGFNFTLPHFP